MSLAHRRQPIDFFVSFIFFFFNLSLNHPSKFKVESDDSIDRYNAYRKIVDRISLLRYNISLFSRLDSSWKSSIHARYEDTQNTRAHRYSASHVCVDGVYRGEKKRSGEKKEEAKEEER